MFNKKIISYIIFTFIVISSCLFIIVAREKPIERIKKDVLMNESELSKELGDIKNIDDDLKFEDVEINTLINISKKCIESKYKIDIDEFKGNVYQIVDDIKESIEKTGLAKITWVIGNSNKQETIDLEKAETIYVVVINSFGEILDCEKIK
ncbi:hypothetical protein [Clostridium sp. C8]|uniref:hypothetical protein n=1 Tax=Clostridium sp. C8 TaxID=1667357 RepID=UPI00062E39EB|nr:hypothetical protein [Clostridium sp. C8]KLE16323.1 hypothetical protein AAT22_06945 [Clostridium sp. C8]